MKSKILKHIIVYVCGLLVLAGLAVGTLFYVKQRQKTIAQTQEHVVAQTQAEMASRLAKVKVVEILPVPFTDILVLPGTVRAYEDIDLAGKIEGIVEWVGPKEGAQVKKGDKLLQVDIKSIRTMLTEARARYNQALQDYKRMEKLYKESITSKGQLDNAKTDLDTSKAALDAVGVNLSDGTLYSPISGILDRLNIDPGEYILAGQTVMKIVDIDKVYIELPVPEKDILYFKKGQNVGLEMSTTQGASEETSDIDEQGKYGFSGTIDFVSMTADPAARTYMIKVIVDNPERILRPGMIVRAHLVRRKLKAAIAVPFFTIIDREEGKAVFVVEGEVARARPIQYGAFYKGLVEIRKGLKLGERLIIVGQRDLVDREKVDVTGDITPLARQWITEGRDLSQLAIDILK